MTASLLEQLSINAKVRLLSRGGLLLDGSPVSIGLPNAPIRYLYSGWQSWSLTAWVEARYPVRPMRPSSLHPMQTDPVHVHDRRPHGAWYGAAELPDGEIVFLGALGLEAQVALDGNILVGRTDTGSGEWFLGVGSEEEIMPRYAEHLAERLGRGRVRTPQRIWCSWYSLYTGIEENQLHKILSDLGDLPFNVFQVDDGWQVAVGDWEANTKFPSGMEALASRIKSTGRSAGLWLAPLLIVPSSSVFREHPDWLLRDEAGQLVSAGFNWGEPLYALDTTHPHALDWLAKLMRQVRAWGYEYAKLDFLYAGALPGKRHVAMPREAAYRKGLETIREALGDAYLLTCGAPILPSLGLCDGLRIGPDVAEYWTSGRDDNLLMNFAIPGGRNSLRTVLHRLWLEPLVQTDPDVVYFRTRRNDLTDEQKSLLQSLAILAGFKATSDIPSWLSEHEKAELRHFLEDQPRTQPKGRASYEIGGRLVDFDPQIGLPPAPGLFTRLAGAALESLANQEWIMRLLWKDGLRRLEKTLRDNPV